MIVRYKPTGQIGEIPDDKFDPSLFEVAQDPRIAPPAPQAPQNPEATVREGLASKFGKGILSFGQSLIQPEIDLVKKTAEQVKTGTVPMVSNEDRAASLLGPAGTLMGIGNLNKEVRPAAEAAASLMVPMGKGGLLRGALLPGAAMGAMASDARGGDLPEIVGSAALGAGTAGVLHGTSRVFSRAGQKTEELGTGVRTANRRITMKPSVYGAGEEKAINKTFDSLGIVGPPAKQYEMLEPAMQKIEGQIQTFIKQNPTITVAKDDIIASFLKNLKSSMRSKDLTQRQAIAEVNGYLTDLLKASGGTGKFTNIDLGILRSLKKLVNEDYGAVYDILERGGTLTPRQRVIKAAWDSLDDAVKTASPEVKGWLVQESHLYKSAPSLSRARFTPPVARIAGTTIPSGVTQTVQDASGRALQKTGASLQRVGGALPTITENPVVQRGTVVGVTGLSGEQNGQEQLNTPQDQRGYNDTSGNLDHTISDYSTTTPQSQVLPAIEPQYTLDELANGYQKALMAGDHAAATTIKQMYDMQSANEKTATPVKKTETQQAREDVGYLAAEAMKQLEMGGVKTGIVAPRVEEAKAIFNTGDTATLTFNNTIAQIKGAIAKARAGTSFTPNEEKLLNRYTPNLGDSDQQLRVKLAGLQDFFNRYQGQNIVPDNQFGLPEINYGVQ